MGRRILTGVAACLAVVGMSGCFSLRSYVINKERVDQDIPGETVAGAPVKTRKVFVVEVVEKDKAASAPSVSTVTPPPAPAPETGREENFTPPVAPAPLNEEVSHAASPASSYVVEKDDTLQKIAKKIYGSYGKWTRIYDANRAVIKDPNFLKPGVTLIIPADTSVPSNVNP